MLELETWELLSYVVTVIGLPFAIGVFWLEQRKERQNEREEIFLKLLDEYTDFAKVLIDNADLKLMTGVSNQDKLSPEQQEKKFIIFDLLISFFERSYILLYDHYMDKHAKRMWHTWETYIDYWVKRPDFREIAPNLLTGTDPDFKQYMKMKFNNCVSGEDR